MSDYKTIFKEEIIGKWIDENEDIEITNKRFVKLNKQYETLYNFTLAYNNYMTHKKNYNSGKEKLTMVESHILLDIVDNPKITVGELAKKWEKTPSAISQTIKTLLKKEFIYREISPENAKYFYLYPSIKGKEFTNCHKKYDNIDIVKTSKTLLEKFYLDEVVSFYMVMEEYTKLLKKKDSK
mgnify:FL=1